MKSSFFSGSVICRYIIYFQKTRSDKEISTLNNKVKKLESLCRALQNERKGKSNLPELGNYSFLPFILILCIVMSHQMRTVLSILVGSLDIVVYFWSQFELGLLELHSVSQSTILCQRNNLKNFCCTIAKQGRKIVIVRV